MVRAAPGIDYKGNIKTMRNKYVAMSPRRRLVIIRQRLADHHFGPNRLVTAVSAVEAMARCLVIDREARPKRNRSRIYPCYRDRSPNELILHYLKRRRIADPCTFFAQNNWLLFGYAVEFRNFFAHQTHYL